MPGMFQPDEATANLARSALVAAYPMGATALDFQRPVIDMLAGMGLVKLGSFDCMAMAWDYTLTPAGRHHTLLSMRNGCD